PLFPYTTLFRSSPFEVQRSKAFPSDKAHTKGPRNPRRPPCLDKLLQSSELSHRSGKILTPIYLLSLHPDWPDSFLLRYIFSPLLQEKRGFQNIVSHRLLRKPL